MKSNPLLFFLLLLSLVAPEKGTAQEASLYRYQFPDQPHQDFYALRREDYLQLTSRQAPKGVKKQAYRRYSEMLAYGKASKFLSGEVYLNWTEMEDYLNRILQRIIPPGAKSETVHLYPMRDPSYNAAALHDGTLFFNIGLLADAENEAAVAAVIGHEYAHYFNNDLENAFLRKEKKKRKRAADKKVTTFYLVHENQKSETMADTMGYTWAARAGYDISQAIHNYYRFIDESHAAEVESGPSGLSNVYTNEKGEEQSKHSLSRILSSHPETVDRIAVLQQYGKDHPSPSLRHQYQVGTASEFHRLQAMARSECLHLLLQQLNYTDCINRAFYYHLFEPANEVYLYYLLEALRRTLYLDPELKEKPFLFEKYGSLLTDGTLLVHRLNLVVRDSVRYGQMKASDFTDTSRTVFTTYQQAFDYFAKICRQNDLKEPLLTMALAANGQLQRDSLLTNYLHQEDIQYRAFAQKLQEGSLYNSQYKKELILSEGPELYRYGRTGAALDFLKTEEKKGSYAPYLSLLKKDFPNVDLLFLSQAMKKSFADAILLKSILVSSVLLENLRSNTHASRVDLFLLDPDYYRLFNKYQLHSLSFISTEGLDDRREMIRAANVINPFFYLFFTYHLRSWFIFGTERYAYTIKYMRFDPSQKEKVTVYEESANYKLTPMNYVNAIYYALIRKK